MLRPMLYCHYQIFDNSSLIFSMAEETKKTKRGVRRNSVRVAASAEPEDVAQAGNTCGHGGCASACRVRYVGQTSHLRDHYALHAARGMTHIWSATIITGLAVVLTGVIGYSVVQAKDGGYASSTPWMPPAVTQADVMVLQAKLEDMERILAELRDSCGAGENGAATSTSSGATSTRSNAATSSGSNIPAPLGEDDGSASGTQEAAWYNKW